jgi:endonuclease/exonuclease/phosphatase family metal-dependent hydrolase
MNQPYSVSFKPSALRSIALPALVVALSMEPLRVLLPGLVWYRANHVVPGLFILFLSGFMAPLLWGFTGPRWALRLTAGGVALARFSMQLSISTDTDLLLSAFAIAGFLLFLPIFMGHLRGMKDKQAPQRFGYGLFLGLALDSALHGAAQTVNLNWIPGMLPILVVTFMAGAVLILLVLEPVPERNAPVDSNWTAALPLLAIGPTLLLQMLLAFGNILAVAGLTWGFTRRLGLRLRHTLGIAAYLLLAASTIDQPGLLSLFNFLALQFVMGLTWAQLLEKAITTPVVQRPIIATSIGFGLGSCLFMLLAFLYYGTLIFSIPIPRYFVLPGAATLLGLSLIHTSFPSRPKEKTSSFDATPLIVAVSLALFSFSSWDVASPTPSSTSPERLPIRVMTYNIHSGVGMNGRQDFEVIAEVIEDSSADIIGLQEISRGWLISGSTDMPAWFARRLDMQMVFRGTSGPMWGNAILSRYPILEYGWGELPLGIFRLRRGYLWALIDVSTTRPLLVINTHMTHDWEDHETHIAEVQTLLEFWDERDYAIVLGDMNSWPGTSEMTLLAEVGLIDSWAEIGIGGGYTLPSTKPNLRIDWIWHTADLKAISVEVIQTEASDHLPVIAVIDAVP